MRSLFWLGGAVLVCAASFVYLAADFARRHPDSLAVRCTRSAHALSVQCNPITALASAGGHAFRAASELMWQAMTVANEAPKPAACVHADGCQAPVCQVSQPVEVIDLSLSPEPSGKADDGLEEAEAPPYVPPWPNPAGAETVTVPPVAIEESDEVRSTMPAADEGDEQIPSPAPMEDLVREQIDATRQHVFELWFDLFQKEVNNSTVTGEEPPADFATEECKDEVKSEPDEAEGPETLPEPGAQEDSETVAPDCQVDPNYHKQYPGCPYMGGDPATHHDPIDGSMHHRKKVKSSPIVDPKPDVEEAEEPPTDAVVPFPMDRPPALDRPRNLDPTPDDDRARHPEVDTMEFRKSDAKEGEFDSRPF